MLLIVTGLTIAGCAGKQPAVNTTQIVNDKPQLPPRPTTPPPPFKVFHQDASSITLVTDPKATDDQISALIFQLRDATHAHALDRLHIDQKIIDHRDPIVWFHLYRGSKCASEKYASGPPPCGASYHAAGDYTFGGFTNRNWDNGVLIHGGGHSTPLWNPDAPYTAP